jgi:hypothetical protein
MRSSSRLTRQRPASRRAPQCQRGIVRRPTALVLVALALLAAPTPEALAQARPRPEPNELWRQFPLETGRSTPAEGGATPGVRTTGGATAEGTDGSGVPVQTAAIVLAMVLVLLLMTGALAYAARDHVEFGASRRRRRLAQSFREFLEAPPVEESPHVEAERPKGTKPNATQIVRDAAAPRRSPKRVPAVGGVVASISSEVHALMAKLDADAAPNRTESPTQDKIQRLRERLNMYFASEDSANDQAESLKAKLDVHRATAKSEGIPHDERERLKEKLGTQPRYSKGASHDELQILKEKLGMQAAAPKSVSTTHEEETLKAKLAKQAALADAERETTDEAALKQKLSGAGAVARLETRVRAPLETQRLDNGPRPASERKLDLDAGTPSPKLDVSERPATDPAQASFALDSLDMTLGERRGGRAAAEAPVAPWLVATAAPRSTITKVVHEHGLDVAVIGLVLIIFALLLLNIAVLFDVGVVS